MRSDIGTFSVVPHWLLDAGVSPTALRVYCALGVYANAEGLAWPSVSTLAQALKTSDRSVQRALAELVALKALVVHARTRPDGSAASNEYTVLYAKPQAGVVAPTSGVGAPVSPGGGAPVSPHELDPDMNYIRIAPYSPSESIPLSAPKADNPSSEGPRKKKESAVAEPYASVEACLTHYHAAIGQPPPDRRQVTRWLKPDSAIRGLIDVYGAERAARLLAWVDHTHVPRGLSPEQVYAQRASLIARFEADAADRPRPAPLGRPERPLWKIGLASRLGAEWRVLDTMPDEKPDDPEAAYWTLLATLTGGVRLHDA